MVDKIRRGLRWLEGVLLPHRCLLCGANGEDGLDLCRGCGEDLPWNRHSCPRCANPLPPGSRPDSLCGACLSGETPRGFDRIHAPLLYDFPLDRLILNLKFHGQLATGRLLGELTAQALASEGVRLPQALVPVPLHRRRWRERGFNQARELARPMARRFQIPIADGLVHRRQHGPAQAELPLDQRRRNIRGLFKVRREPPGHVAIVDDVVTSASTVAELARTLKQAGATRVDVWAIARTP
ncbi:ComF family protein [Natronospira proteinivora]|uniref:ComF family protein n=1 Tax=Natronospira proteinivora TaxID=1807133 RepID=A0ABT1GAM6_9GAMM|nr:ComF family protein [Natronospira proteinivora]MCP1727960.1 ComF family protein [Natronospira proteinivora]